MFARAPATSANLGPGFDALAVALGLYVEVTVDVADEFAISSEGCGAGLFDDENHLAARVAKSVLGHSNFALHVNSSIPLSRGLGSSAALAVAAAAAAGAADPLTVAAELDGHGENAAASLFGGLVVASMGDDGVVARSLPLDEIWRFVVVVPDEELATSDARRALPDRVAFSDAVHNLSALGLLIAGLGDHRQFVASSMDDVLHQPYRAPLMEFSIDLLKELRDAGAAGSCWSGAGSSMLGLVTSETAADVALGAKEFLHVRSIPGEVYTLDADRVGLVTH
jgi:homoserine kinase